MGKPPFFEILEKVDSTSNHAMARVQEGSAKQGMAWFAREQLQGRGQRGNQWDSEPGQNLLMTVVLEPDQWPLEHQALFNMAIAVTCRDFLSRYTGEATAIKWPNDLYWRNRKLGGILIENSIQGNTWKFALVGIGINVNQERFNSSIPNPVSVKQATGQEYDPVEMAKKLHADILLKMDEWGTADHLRILEPYNRHLYGINRKMKLMKNDFVFETLVRSVNEKGQLVTGEDELQVFDFGEVKWVI